MENTLPLEKVHITLIRVGDTVFYRGHARTISGTTLSHIAGMGPALWGDTYKLGTEPVLRVIPNKGGNRAATPDDIRTMFDQNPDLTMGQLALTTGRTVKQLKTILMGSE